MNMERIGAFGAAAVALGASFYASEARREAAESAELVAMATQTTRVSPSMIKSASANSVMRGDGTRQVEQTKVTIASTGQLAVNPDSGTIGVQITHLSGSTIPLNVTYSGTPGSGAGSLLQLNSNAASIPTASGHRLGGVWFTAGGNRGGALESYSTEAWSGSARGAELRFLTTTTGSTSVVERMRITGLGSVALNVGSALATGATSGFTWLPNMAGVPSGTPSESFSGATAMVVDSTNSRLYARLGGAWRYLQFGPTNGLNVLTKNADYTITASDVGPGGLLLVAGKASGTITITLPSVSAIPSGVPIVIKRSSVNSELATITVASTGAGEPIHRGSSATGTSFSLTANGQSETLYGNGSAIWYAES